MSNLGNATPAPRVHCELINRDKNYANKGNMMTHIRKHHMVVDQINSPLGSFSQATSARVLFGEANVSSVQGNSDGQVNSSKVLSVESVENNLQLKQK